MTIKKTQKRPKGLKQIAKLYGAVIILLLMASCSASNNYSRKYKGGIYNVTIQTVDSLQEGESIVKIATYNQNDSLMLCFIVIDNLATDEEPLMTNSGYEGNVEIKLPPGKYSIGCLSQGYKVLKIKKLKLEENEVATIEAYLKETQVVFTHRY